MAFLALPGTQRYRVGAYKIDNGDSNPVLGGVERT
jgi:hypothetical protein